MKLTFSKRGPGGGLIDGEQVAEINEKVFTWTGTVRNLLTLAFITT